MKGLLNVLKKNISELEGEFLILENDTFRGLFNIHRSDMSKGKEIKIEFKLEDVKLEPLQLNFEELVKQGISFNEEECTMSFPFSPYVISLSFENDRSSQGTYIIKKI